MNQVTVECNPAQRDITVRPRFVVDCIVLFFQELDAGVRTQGRPRWQPKREGSERDLSETILWRTSSRS